MILMVGKFILLFIVIGNDIYFLWLVILPMSGWFYPTTVTSNKNPHIAIFFEHSKMSGLEPHDSN